MAKPKILIVDDEPFNLDYLEKELKDFDCETLTAANGQEALDQVQSQAPDLVLLEITMPVMDGFEVLSRLKGDAATRDIPVIIISTSNNLQSLARGIQLGAEDYLPRPFEPTLLHARISSCLEKKRLRDLQQLYLKGLEREMEIARKIQASFLPEELPQIPGWEIDARFQPARHVAGDFYDVFPLVQNRRVGLVIGDVCDKGVGAALFMALFRTLIRAFAQQHYAIRWMGDISEGGQDLPANSQRAALPSVGTSALKNAMELTNNYIARTHGSTSMFSTLFFGVLDPSNGMLMYVNGGHEYPILVNSAGIKKELATTGPLVGIIPDANFNIQTVCIEPGDTLVAFTDGVTEAHVKDGELYGNERLCALLTQPFSSASELLDRILASVNNYTGEADPFDDITLLAVRRQ